MDDKKGANGSTTNGWNREMKDGRSVRVETCEREEKRYHAINYSQGERKGGREEESLA